MHFLSGLLLEHELFSRNFPLHDFFLHFAHSPITFLMAPLVIIMFVDFVLYTHKGLPCVFIQV